MPRVGWKFVDNSTGTPVEYEFPINPYSFVPPGRNATIQVESVTAPSGGAIIMQGRDKVASGSMTGKVRTSTQRDDLETWADKWYPLVLTDDNDESWTILITSISWDRRKSITTTHKFEYTIEFLEVG